MTYTFRPGESSLVYSLIIVEDEPPAPAALVDIGFSVPSFRAAARRLLHVTGVQQGYTVKEISNDDLLRSSG